MCNEEINRIINAISNRILIAIGAILFCIVLVFTISESIFQSRFKTLDNKIDSLQLKVEQLQPCNFHYVSPTDRGN